MAINEKLNSNSSDNTGFSFSDAVNELGKDIPTLRPYAYKRDSNTKLDSSVKSSLNVTNGLTYGALNLMVGLPPSFNGFVDPSWEWLLDEKKSITDRISHQDHLTKYNTAGMAYTENVLMTGQFVSMAPGNIVLGDSGNGEELLQSLENANSEKENLDNEASRNFLAAGISFKSNTREYMIRVNHYMRVCAILLNIGHYFAEGSEYTYGRNIDAIFPGQSNLSAVMQINIKGDNNEFDINKVYEKDKNVTENLASSDGAGNTNLVANNNQVNYTTTTTGKPDTIKNDVANGIIDKIPDTDLKNNASQTSNSGSKVVENLPSEVEDKKGTNANLGNVKISTEGMDLSKIATLGQIGYTTGIDGAWNELSKPLIKGGKKLANLTIKGINRVTGLNLKEINENTGEINPDTVFVRMISGLSSDALFKTVTFYVDGNIELNESIMNDVSDSTVFQSVSSIKEAGQFGDILKEFALNGASSEDDSIRNVLWNPVIPKLWKDFKMDLNYSIPITAVSCGSDPLSILMYNLRALCYLGPFIRPRAVSPSLLGFSATNSFYKSPMFVRAFARGIMNVTEGIISSITIERDPQFINLQGIPLQLKFTIILSALRAQEVQPSISLNDLLVQMHERNYMNGTFENYLATVCGINTMNHTKLDTFFNMIKSIWQGTGVAADGGIAAGITNYLGDAIVSLKAKS